MSKPSNLSSLELLPMVFGSTQPGHAVRMSRLSEADRARIEEFERFPIDVRLSRSKIREAALALVAMEIPEELAAKLLNESCDGGWPMLYLAKNPSLIKLFDGLSDSEFEIQYTELRERSVPKTTNAPPPPNPVSGGFPSQNLSESSTRSHNCRRGSTVEPTLGLPTHRRKSVGDWPQRSN